jgi:hypothetical protein
MLGGNMKKYVLALSALISILPAISFADSAVQYLFTSDLRAGYGFADMKYWDGTPFIQGLDLNGVETTADMAYALLVPLGPLRSGARFGASASYLTGFGKDYFGIEHDQVIFACSLDWMIAYDGVASIFPYALLGATYAPLYYLMDPRHFWGGASEEWVPGVRAALGLSWLPLSFGKGWRAGLEAEANTGFLFPQDFYYWFILPHISVTVQWKED